MYFSLSFISFPSAASAEEKVARRQTSAKVSEEVPAAYPVDFSI